MNVSMTLILAAAGMNLTACASPGMLSDPPAHRLSVGGESYLLRQITESTWTVSSTAHLKVLANTPATTASLRQAVENASSCKVTDSDYSAQGKQFDAQVECPGALAR